MHPIHGTWKILARGPIGELPSVNEITAEGDTFSGVMHDEKSGKDFPIFNGKIDGNHVTFEATMKMGFVSMTFQLEGDVSEDGQTCKGTFKALKMEGTFEGEKLS